MSKPQSKLKVTLHLETKAYSALVELGATERTTGALISRIILDYHARVMLASRLIKEPSDPATIPQRRGDPQNVKEIAAELHRLADQLLAAYETE